jgi:hypothetical protein
MEQEVQEKDSLLLKVEGESFEDICVSYKATTWASNGQNHHAAIECSLSNMDGCDKRLSDAIEVSKSLTHRRNKAEIMEHKKGKKADKLGNCFKVSFN